MCKGEKSKWFLLVLILIIFSGCSYKPTSQINYAKKKPIEFNKHYDVIKKPEVNKIAECEVGGSIILMSQAYFIPKVKIDVISNNTITCTAKSVDAKKNSTINKIFNAQNEYTRLTIHDRQLTLSGYNKYGAFYKSDTGVKVEYFTKDTSGKPAFSRQTEGGIYIPYNSSQPNKVYWGENPYKSSKSKTYSVTVQNCPYQYTELEPKTVTKKHLPKTQFKREILYLGKSGETINLSYREFKDNLARPAFSQELTFDLSENDIIGYQEARFKVLEATNTKIRYKVLEHLPYYPQ